MKDSHLIAEALGGLAGGGGVQGGYPKARTFSQSIPTIDPPGGGYPTPSFYGLQLF